VRALRSCLAVMVMLALMMLAGCATVPRPMEEARNVSVLLANYNRVTLLPMEQQQREFYAALDAQGKSASDMTRLNLALMMLAPRVPWRNDSAVMALLAGVKIAQDGQSSPYHDLAQFLMRFVIEEIREELEERRKLEQLNQQLHDERQRSGELRQKLDALHATDREMRTRRKAR